jgi:HJR/Mrr/RecB family endonuclease
MKRLNIGNSGGIRVSLTKGSKVARIVLFSTSEQEANPQENPYLDRSEGAILTYTGTGKFGNQNLTGQNLRITQQATEFFPIYVFSLLQHRKSLGSPEKRWRFAGIYKYLNHARENQSDLLGVDRSAWIFKLVRLNINEAGTELEPVVARIISQAYHDSTLSAQILLEDSGVILSIDLDKAVDKMNSLNPFAFEHFVKTALVESRFREVKVTKKSSDGGVDIVARMPLTVWPIAGQIIHLQVKRWQRSVGRREVAQLRGSLVPRALGAMVTTGNYARTAIVESERPHLLPISLIDGHQLASVAIRLNLEIA